MDVATIGAVWEFKAYGGGGTSKRICHSEEADLFYHHLAPLYRFRTIPGSVDISWTRRIRLCRKIQAQQIPADLLPISRDLGFVKWGWQTEVDPVAD